MNGVVLALILFTFVTGMGGLLSLVWALSRGHVTWSATGAKVIFADGEHGEDPADPSGSLHDHGEMNAELAERRALDVSSRGPVLTFLVSSVFWLVFGSLLGLVASLKLTFPDWLVGDAALTFGRIRPLHLNVVAYGWASMGGIAVALWLVPRLTKAPLRAGRYATMGAWVWNVGMGLGSAALLAGWTDGVEWLEFPWQVDIFFVVAGGLAGLPLLATVIARKVKHLYVSIWYLGAAFLWFPMLFVVANIPRTHFGVEHATVNWWFAHNVLGLWLTPLGLASAYYFIPKVLGKPIHSYGLSMVGFWSLALFYSQVGNHHLIGGPVPTWLVSISIVHSVMMIVPVAAVGINHHFTILGDFGKVFRSPTLRFSVLGAMMYTLTSVEGSLQSLRTVNRLTHFTHFTVAHAHFGVYGFVSFTLFGGIYFLVPRIVGRDWPHPRLVAAHFWLAFVGISVYVVGLSIGGILQGRAMLDASRPFMDSVLVTIPWLHSRTAGGLLMTLAHLVFALHLFLLLREPAGAPREDGKVHDKAPAPGADAAFEEVST